MEIDNAQNQQQEEEDPFLGLIEYARSVLWPGEEEEGRDESGQDPNNTGSKSRGPGWGWIASRILKTCIAYSSGVTVAILLSDLAQKGREVFLTGCYLRTAREGCGSPRLLPTEYLVILLDEDHDAILLDFYSDSFSSISLDAFNNGVSYSFNARIESIGLLETQGEFDSIQRRQITLVDNDGVKMKFLLWGEQVLIANLFSIGSTLALDRPYIALETSDECCLEYGTATQLYLVPFIQQEEQVCVPLTQNRYQGSRLLSAVDPSQVPIVSQVTLPCDSQGSIDFSNYPFRPFIINLCDKMTGLSLYGVVIDIFHKENTPGVYSLKIEDTTGVITVKIHFADSWSLGRLGPGHVVYISGLTCSMTKQNRLEVLWSEKDAGASFVNLSCLPALLNSSCLHRSSCLSDLSNGASYMFLCRVWLDQIDSCFVNTRFAHALCGHFVNERPTGVFECSFCHIQCSAELVRTFHLKVTLADESTKVLAWCTGQTAIELLQISPNEFYELPEEEQIMYPSSLEGERFLVALVNCKRGHYESSDGITQETQAISWEITRALKWE
ncbi:hypothetical protein CISIN_1g008739mg [Citrus sinensis]|uniref:Cell division control protein 24 OB domain-containing protein n=1 Tax=Citrus sinensis TaxID=2711 RepID=A0A067FX46_CITSI|nr:hypothetical protein CISIN_1g008739mg [Citrus sinensis]